MNIVHWLPRYHVAQKLLLDLPAEARVLDVACGEGDLAKFMSERGCRVWGADLGEADIRRGFPRNQGATVAYAVADAGILPFASEAFDWLVTFGTLQVLPDDANAVSEFTRVLKPGGTLIVCSDIRIPNAGDLFWEQRALRRWLPRWLHSRSRAPGSKRDWLDSQPEDVVYFRDYPLAEVCRKFTEFELLEHDYALKRFSALAMDCAYGVRGFPRLGLKPYIYWFGSRLDAIFCRGPRHSGYTLLAKLRKR